jgi:hypothetical protein
MISNFENAGADCLKLPAQKPNPFSAHLDSGNLFAVGAAKVEMLKVIELQINRPVPARLSKDEALNLAAWIVAMVDPEKKHLDQLLERIQNS